MAVCEFHKEYMEYLNERIDCELTEDGFNGTASWPQVWSVVQNTAICASLENISKREAGIIFRTVYRFYPQLEEKLKAEMEKKHLFCGA